MIESDLYFIPFIYSASKKKKKKKITGVKSHFSSHIRTKINNNKKNVFLQRPNCSLMCKTRLQRWTVWLWSTCNPAAWVCWQLLFIMWWKTVGRRVKWNMIRSQKYEFMNYRQHRSHFFHNSNCFFFYSKPPENNHSPDCPGLLSKTCT